MDSLTEIARRLAEEWKDKPLPSKPPWPEQCPCPQCQTNASGCVICQVHGDSRDLVRMPRGILLHRACYRWVYEQEPEAEGGVQVICQ